MLQLRILGAITSLKSRRYPIEAVHNINIYGLTFLMYSVEIDLSSSSEVSYLCKVLILLMSVVAETPFLSVGALVGVSYVLLQCNAFAGPSFLKLKVCHCF